MLFHKNPLKSQFSFNKLNNLPLYLLFHIILSVFLSSSDASTHFHIEIPSNNNNNNNNNNSINNNSNSISNEKPPLLNSSPIKNNVQI